MTRRLLLISGACSALPTACGPPAPQAPAAVVSPTAGLGGRIIYLDAPLPGATVGDPVPVRGRVTVSPFEATLRGRVYDAGGALLGEGPIMVTAEMGRPGPFTGTIPLRAGRIAAAGLARVEVAEVSARDGAVIVSATAEIRLAPR
jgi:hypothetical protein